jgi:AraC-like DNA-binding protein
VTPPYATDPCQLVRDVIVGRLAGGSIRAVLSDSRDGLLMEPSGRTADPYLPRMHAHGSSVCWVVAGQCVVEVPHHWVRLDASHALLLRSGEEHRIRPLPDLSTFDVLSWNLSARGVRVVRDSFAPPGRRRMDAFVELPAPVSPLLEGIRRELEVRRPHSDLFVCAALLETAARILRARAERGAPVAGTGTGDAPPGGLRHRSGTQTDGLVDQLARHVEASYAERIMLRQLARAVGLSPSYLTTLFRRHTGKSLMAYLGDVRHREAVALLRTTDLDVARIADRVGYDDPHYFARVFKAREGCGPAQYRRLVRLAGSGP